MPHAIKKEGSEEEYKAEKGDTLDEVPAVHITIFPSQGCGKLIITHRPLPNHSPFFFFPNILWNIFFFLTVSFSGSPIFTGSVFTGSSFCGFLSSSFTGLLSGPIYSRGL